MRHTRVEEAGVANDAPPPPVHTRRIPNFALRLVALGSVLLALGVLLRVFVRVSQQDVEDAVERAGLLAPAAYAFVLTLGLTVPFNPVSDLLTVSAAALLLDPPMAIAATFVAHSAALSLNYVVARRFGDRTLRLLAGQRASALVSRLGDRMSYRTIFLVRFMLPLTAVGIDVVSYLAGMRKLSFARFFVASIVPWTLLSVVFFTSTAFVREQAPLLLLVPVAVLVVAPTLALLLRHGG
jgi:uncharacterized membrane protein YdjX (TVP38/TMEM64 family)